MKISKNEIEKYYKSRRLEFLKEAYNKLPTIQKISESTYLVMSEDKAVSAYVNFTLEDYPDLYGPKLEKEDVVCYSLEWDFTEESKKAPIYWTNVTATMPAVIDIFIREVKTLDVIYFKGMTGTSTGAEYGKPGFEEKIKTIFSDKFWFYKASSGAFPKFFLIDKNIRLSSDLNEIKKELSKGRLSLQEIETLYKVGVHPWKYKDKLKGIHKWSIIKEQIDRVILKKIYL